MRIVIDERIEAARKAFGPLGDVITTPGREIDTEDVSRADALIVRSVTRVDRTLLGGSQVRFVGTTTSGHDHVDVDWLRERDIGFAHAPGCNATAVADWVLAALAVLDRRGRHAFGRGTAAVIGAGEVGSRVARRLAAVGYAVRLHDPPRVAREGPDGFVDLETALDSDVVSLHVPLTETGGHPTRNLVDAVALERVRSGAVLLNAARGGVLDERALVRRLDEGVPLAAAIDTWAREPDISPELLQRVDLATPHIAGHSLEGRLRGTAMVARAAGAHFDVPLDWDWTADLPPGPTLPPVDDPVAAILEAHDPRNDDARLRTLLQLAPSERPTAFDHVRAASPKRREFGFHAVPANVPAAVAAAGFGVADPADGRLTHTFVPA